MFRSCNRIRSARRLFAACSFMVAAAAGHAYGSEPSPGMLGVTLTDWAGRVLVKDVYVDSPAYVAGLRPEDRIIAVGHKAVNTAAQLTEVLSEYGANDRVEIYASRDGWMKDLPITLAKREDVVGKPLLSATETPRATAATQDRTRRGPVQPVPSLTHPDPFHRLRYERW